MLPIQDVILQFLEKLQETKYFSEKPIVVSFVIDELRDKKLLFETSKVEKIRGLKVLHTGYRDISVKLSKQLYIFLKSISQQDLPPS